MKKIRLIALIIGLFHTLVFSQNVKQTVRGTILDTDSKLPLIGVSVIILGTEPRIGTITDEKGEFRFENIPVGRITLQLYYLGYENMSAPNIEVNSGKQAVLNLNMRENITVIEEVVVKANKDKGEAENDMSLISARSISPEESKLYAGSFNDPARILANFAGVATQDGSNTIIVRGNSPKYMQWRLEGVEITNPNHFNDQNSASGSISALNNNLLATSDFQTGAFSPEYGDVLSGVYDVSLRAGNNQKREATFGLGLLGTDITLEGPFKKGYGGSYLVNYRYSTVSLIAEMGLVKVGGIPKFQDGAFKIALPANKFGTFSLFGLWGYSTVSFKDVKPNIWDLPGDRGMKAETSEDFDKEASLLNTGINHTLPINSNSFIKTSLSYSGSGITDDVFEIKTTKINDAQGAFLRDSVGTKILNFNSRLIKSTYRGAITYNHKLNARHKIQIGTKYALFEYNYFQSQLQNDGNTRTTVVDFKESIGTIRNYISWKYRLNERITMVAGVHNMNVLYNSKSTLEPRLAINWKLNNTSSIHAGYGNHSTMESVHNYFAKVTLTDGSIAEPNKNLDLLKANHFVLGYEKRFTDNLMAKFEVYYQDLYNLPVENNDTSYYSTINEGTEFKYVALTNKGTGKNYGVELTVERFFANNYYFLVNGSVYNSTYRSLENVERNTQYNGNYLANFLCGKVFDKLGKKKNQSLTLNARIFFGGGKKILSLLRDSQGNVAVDQANGRFWDYKKAYENKVEDPYQVTISASYKWNKPRTTHEIFINLDNLTDNKCKISEYYDNSQPNSIGYVKQFGFFPNLMYRVYF